MALYINYVSQVIGYKPCGVGQAPPTATLTPTLSPQSVGHVVAPMWHQIEHHFVFFGGW